MQHDCFYNICIGQSEMIVRNIIMIRLFTVKVSGCTVCQTVSLDEFGELVSFVFRFKNSSTDIISKNFVFDSANLIKMRFLTVKIRYITCTPRMTQIHTQEIIFGVGLLCYIYAMLHLFTYPLKIFVYKFTFFFSIFCLGRRRCTEKQFIILVMNTADVCFVT
jgi:DMSO/TMAO reductase YedYZ heme-binding membrane subunit